jgi:hypothetical protein
MVADHFAGIVRYVSDYSWKNITVTEYQHAMSLGLTVTLVCEQDNQQTLRGVLGGMHDSTIADQQATALGYPPDATIYYVAEDPSVLPESDWPTVVEYFQGLNWGSNRPKGAYGSGPLLAHLLSLGLVTHTWNVSTWGAPQGNALEQLVGANTYELAVDVDEVLAVDYGQAPRPVVAPPAPAPPAPTPTPGAEVNAHPITFAVAGGNGWAASPVPAGSVVNVVVLDENPQNVDRYDNIPSFSGVATSASANAPNGALVFKGGADGTYGATVWSTE